MLFPRLNRYEFAAAIGTLGAVMLFMDAITWRSGLPLYRIYFESFWPAPTPRDTLRVIQAVVAIFFGILSIAVPWGLERRSKRKQTESRDASNSKKPGNA